MTCLSHFIPRTKNGQKHVGNLRKCWEWIRNDKKGWEMKNSENGAFAVISQL